MVFKRVERFAKKLGRPKMKEGGTTKESRQVLQDEGQGHHIQVG
jgi:hypothetical protein